jgi:hypothetical protein
LYEKKTKKSQSLNNLFARVDDFYLEEQFLLTFLEEPSERGLLEEAFVHRGKASFRVDPGLERAFRGLGMASWEDDQELEKAFLDDHPESDPSFWELQLEAFQVILGKAYPEQILEFHYLQQVMFHWRVKEALKKSI